MAHQRLMYTQHLGGVMDSTTVTKPAVHAVMTANHVNPKLLTNSCQRRQLRTSGLNPVSGLSQDASIEGVTVIQNWTAVAYVSGVTVKFYENRGLRPDRWAVGR